MAERHPKAPEIIALRRDGYKYGEICKRLRVSKGVVAGVVRRANLTKARVPYTPKPRKQSKRRKQQLLPAPPGAHPLVNRLIERVNVDHRYWNDIADEAGVPRYRLNHWRYHCYPNLAEIEACFNVLGRALIDVPLPLVDKP